MKINGLNWLTLTFMCFVLAACGSDSKTPDTDGDGVPDSFDVFPQDARESKDTDQDGVGDNSDAFPNDATETVDRDTDTVGDNSDNCPGTPNSDQLNTDADALGNACDDDDDDDNDEALDDDDAFPLDATEQRDIDNDELGDNKDLDLDRTQKNSASIERLIEQELVVRIVAPQAIDESGEIGDAISNAGDVNNDGFDDLLIGFYDYENNEVSSLGICYLIFGRASGFPNDISLAQLEQSDLEYVVFQADENETDSLGIGATVSALGDINGDEIDDFSIAALFTDTNIGEKSGGEAYIVFGRDTWPDKNITISELKTTYAVGFKGQQKFGLLGQSIINAGDLNNDGKPDLLISEYRYDVGMVEDAGRVHIVFGGDHLNPPVNNQVSVRNIDDLPSTIHTVLNGLGPFSISGLFTKAVGDFNQDQIADVAITSQDYGATKRNGGDGVGAVSIVFGRTNWPAEINLADLTGADGFNIVGDGPGLQFGKAITSGDFNNDQIPDVIIGAPDHTDSTESEPNKVYMLWGGTGPWPASITSTQIETTYGNAITSDSDIGLGTSLDVLEDTNGDGQVELMMVSDFSDRPNSQTFLESGRFFKVNSRTSWNDVVLTYTDLPPEVDRIGSTYISQAEGIRALGDYNGDGVQEMLFDFKTGFQRVDRLDEAYIIYGYRNLIPETQAQ